MQLTDDDLQIFRQLWLEEFQESISVDDSRRYATTLLDLYLLLVRFDQTEPSELSHLP